MTDLSVTLPPIIERRPDTGQMRPPGGTDQRGLIFGLGACFIAASFALLKTGLLDDPDTHWHVATGRWIVEHRAWPHVDMFSHTAAGQPWIAKEWLSQVVMFGAHALGGWFGVTTLAVLCLGASMAMVAARLGRHQSGTSVTLLAMLVFLAASMSILARPHIIALPLMVIWTLGIVEALDQRRPPHWLLLPVMLLWANAHAGYTIGFVIAGVLGLEAVRDAGDGRRALMALRWAAFLVLALVASCLTPYGFESLVLTKNMFAGSGREGIALVEEWEPLPFNPQGAFALILAAVVLAGLALQPRRNVFRIVLVLILGWMMIRHTRFALLFAFTAVPVGMATIATGPLGRWIGRRDQNQGQARAWLVGAFALAGLTMTLILASRAEISPTTTPIAAVQAAHALGLTERKVYNRYGFGGYLISQGIPTFIDGRTDQLFLNGFFKAYDELQKPDRSKEFAAYLKRYDVGWALVKSNTRQFDALKALGWRTVHEDQIAVVMVPPGSEPQAMATGTEAVAVPHEPTFATKDLARDPT